MQFGMGLGGRGVNPNYSNEVFSNHLPNRAADCSSFHVTLSSLKKKKFQWRITAGNVLQVLEATQVIVWLGYMWFPY